MILRVLLSILLMLGAVSVQTALSQTARAQTSKNMQEEQAAICASYAQIMEYAGLIDGNQGKIWGERKLYAAALLYNNLPESTELDAKIRHIDQVIDEYSIWMIEIFANLHNGQASNDDRDALKAYIGNFCIQIFAHADKAIAKLRPHLFAVEKPPLPEIAPEIAPKIAHIQIAAYSTKKAAENGLKQMQQDLEQYGIKFFIKDAGKTDPLFRIISDSLSAQNAEKICATFKEKQQGCIIKMTKG